MSPGEGFQGVEVPSFSDLQHVARIQRFSSGGFEGTCYWRSKDRYRSNTLGLLPRVARVRDKAEVVLEKAQRARKRVRWLAREIGADHLLTLTTREAANDPHLLLRRFERFAELYRKALAGQPFLYVGVPEPHPSNPNHWHVHVAVRGRVHVNVARGIWWALCGGRGQGNVDARFIKCRGGLDRSLRIARYLGKYITKSFGDRAELDGSHRYRASRVTLERRSVLVFEAGSVNEALSILLDKLRLVRGDVDVVFFSDYSGFWFSCSGDIAEIEPPF
jgi:hypothetical protein